MLLLRASLSLTLLLAALASASPCAIPLAGLHTSSSVLDLEPLLARRREVARAVLTPPSLTTTVYAWGDCAHGIGHDGQLPDFEQCPPSTLVCMTGSNSRPNHRAEPPRIVSVAAVAASLKGASARLVPRSDSEYADIEVTLLGEDYVHERQTVEILLVCDPSAPEPSDPTFANVKDGAHRFEWVTRGACVEVARVGPAAPPSDERPVEEDPTPPPAEGDVSDEGRPRADTARPFLYASGALNVLLLALIALSLRSLRHLRTQPTSLHSILPRSPFAPAPSKFPAVRYASAVFDVDDDEGGEQQPLTPRTPLLEGGSGEGHRLYGGRR